MGSGEKESERQINQLMAPLRYKSYFCEYNLTDKTVQCNISSHDSKYYIREEAYKSETCSLWQLCTAAIERKPDWAEFIKLK